MSKITSIEKSWNDEEYLKNTEENAWRTLFEIHCTNEPEKVDIYI